MKTHETLGGVVHEAHLEALLVVKRLGQRLPQGVRGQRRLVAVLELREDHLQSQHTSVDGDVTCHKCCL